MQKKRKIELLSPAKTPEIGKEAILHGADAVYIGGPKFGARAMAGNDVKGIAELCDFAHLYDASVYVTLNTILTDEQLLEAERLAWEMYNVGVDALIVQDVGLLECSLPPIALHASTQMDNRTPEKVKFLEESGFSQVVLARELSLNEIQDIHKQTSVPLESFVHGALCVGRSGACYLSQWMQERSANRGECAQCCRLSYDLVDGEGRLILKNKYPLSLKDLNLSNYLEQMIDSGVSSFKIEGRLKEVEYVKNTTAYYRSLLDKILENRSDLTRSSFGNTHTFFTPDLQKTFNRGFTSYYITGYRGEEVVSFHSPKSIGEEIGRVRKMEKGSFFVSTSKELHNGDGFCFVDKDGNFNGFRANRAENGWITPAQKVSISQGVTLYRNLDIAFQKQLQKPSAERKIEVFLTFHSHSFGYSLEIKDRNGHCSSLTFEVEKQEAQRPQREKIREQLGRLGDTPLQAVEVKVEWEKEYFIPTAQLNEWRRLCVEQFLSVCRWNHRPPLRPKVVPIVEYPEKQLDYRANIINQKARHFYSIRGVKQMDNGFELSSKGCNTLMTTKHCLRHALGYCSKQKGGKEFKGEWQLRHGKNTFSLKFDCKRCEMQVILPQ